MTVFTDREWIQGRKASDTTMMNEYRILGELIPVGGGDPIPLIRKKMLAGRRESCDIMLNFPNVSGRHCEFYLEAGYWFVRDLESSNGTKVAGKRVKEKRIDPGTEVAISKHLFTLNYSPIDNGAVGLPPPDPAEESIMSRGLLERAGLERRRTLEDAGRSDRQQRNTQRRSGEVHRYELLSDDAGPEDWRITPM